jgi:hypothetical protein
MLGKNSVHKIIHFVYIVMCCLKAGILESEDWYGYCEATASLNAFPLQRASQLLENGWPELDMFQTVRRCASMAR